MLILTILYSARPHVQTFFQNLCLHVVHICEQQGKFKFFKFSIKVGLYLENPFCINRFLAFWKVDKLPNFVLLYKIFSASYLESNHDVL